MREVKLTKEQVVVLASAVERVTKSRDQLTTAVQYQQALLVMLNVRPEDVIALNGDVLILRDGLAVDTSEENR